MYVCMWNSKTLVSTSNEAHGSNNNKFKTWTYVFSFDIAVFYSIIKHTPAQTYAQIHMFMSK